MIKKIWMLSDALDVLKFDFLIILFVTIQPDTDA
jgi:hypothetical protein